jgi:hypothetical protein
MIKKKKICSGCDKEQYIWKNHEGNKYCQQCWNRIKFDNDPPKPKKRTPIKPKSKKQAAADRAYSLLRIPFLEKNPMCQAALPGCTGTSTDVHHKKGRGKWMLITGTWMAVCRHCHTWIELHPIEATEMGFRVSKITE